MANDIASIGVQLETASIERGISSLKTLSEQGPQVERAMQGIEGAAAKSGRSIANLGPASASIDKVTSSTVRASEAFAIFKGGLAAISAAAGLKQLGSMADQMTNMESRLKLVTSSTIELATVQDGLFKIAQTSRVRFVDLADTYAQMARATKELGVSQKDMLQVTQTISQAVTISGGSAASAQAALIQLSQGFASGTLRGDELNSVLEQTPRLAQAIAQGLGISTGELRKLGAEGELTAEKVLGALKKSAGQVQADFEQMSVTVEQSLTRVGNSLLNLIGTLDKLTGASAGTAGVLSRFSTNLDSLDAQVKSMAASNGLSDFFFTAFNTEKTLNAELATSQAELDALKARLEKAPQNIYLKSATADAQNLVNKLIEAKARLLDLNSGAAGANPADAYMKFPTMSQSYANYAKQQASSEKALQEIRMRKQGISPQYFKDMNAFQEALKLGTLSPDGYIKEMSALAKRTYDSSTAGKDAKKGAAGAKSAAGLAERMGAAQAGMDLSAIAKKYEELTSIYSGSEQILETLRRSGVMGEQEYYASKISFVNLNIDAKKRELEEENKVLEAQNATGVRDINRDKKIADNKAKINKLTIDAVMQTENLGLQAKAAEAAQVGQFTAARQAAEDYLEVLQRGFDRDVAAVGMSDNERNIANGRNQIKDRYADQRREFDNQRELARVNAGGTLAADIAKFYQDKIDLSRVYEDQALKAYTQGVAGRLAAEGDWLIGADRAFKNYAYTASNVAQQTADAFSNAFKGMEDALVTFVTTGKLSFTDMANSIVADITRIIIKQQLSNAMGVAGSGGSAGSGLMGLIGAGLGMVGGNSAVATAANALPGDSLDNFLALKGLATGGYTGDGGKYEPAGIVHRGEYVINAESTKRIGLGLLSRLNGYSSGGYVQGLRQALQPVPAYPSSGGQPVSSGGSPIYVTVQMPQGASRDTAMQFGRTVGRQIQVAQSRNG